MQYIAYGNNNTRVRCESVPPVEDALDEKQIAVSRLLGEIPILVHICLDIMYIKEYKRLSREDKTLAAYMIKSVCRHARYTTKYRVVLVHFIIPKKIKYVNTS
jgi:hypothetical protein